MTFSLSDCIVETKKDNVILCDIDGTIANIDHRRPHVMGKKKDFKTFNALQYKDTLIESTVRVLEAITMREGLQVLYVSGRSEEYRGLTERWLFDNLRGRKLLHTGLLMRPEGDYRCDAEVKEEIYLTKIKPRYKVFMVFDDRNKVVDMWRKHGLVCQQVADGNF